MVSFMRKLTGEKRVGHIGTLDPFATGLLVLALGKAVRLVEYLQGLPKVYTATLHLGKVSTTYDPEGTITEYADTSCIDVAAIEKILPTFVGDIDQIPPKFSAIKIDGKRAYKGARKGHDIKMPTRRIHIEYIKILSYNEPYLELEVACSTGTYIRSLGYDIGIALGVGAYVKELRRVSVDTYRLDDKCTVLDMTRQDIDNLLIPLREIQLNMCKVIVSDEIEQGLVYGVQPQLPTSYENNTNIQLKNMKDELLAIGIAEEGFIKLSKVLI